MPSLEN
jgi:hypothetical protein